MEFNFDPVIFTCSLIATAIGFYFGYKRGKGEPVIHYSNLGGWLPIEENEIPDCDNMQEFIITDGTKVKSSYLGHYDKNGKLKYCNYEENSFVSHWMHLPRPPVKRLWKKDKYLQD